MVALCGNAIVPLFYGWLADTFKPKTILQGDDVAIIIDLIEENLMDAKDNRKEL